MEKRVEMGNEILSKINNLPDEDVQLLASILELRKYRKGEILLKEGETANHLVYVHQGILRQYYYKKGKDITEHFTTKGNTAFCIHSLFLNEPTALMMEATVDCVVYLIPYDKFKKLTFSSPLLADWIRRFYEKDLILTQEKADSWRFESSDERYCRFVKEYPEVVQKASVNHIASYLLMTPESLSRARFKFAKGKKEV
jgi:CRP-like cAMP-binding protein